MKDYKFIFEDGTARSTRDLQAWVIFMECCELRVANSTINNVFVSTVFIALDSSGQEPPLLFETMIFGENVPPLNESRWQYQSIKDARRGHELACERVKEFFPEAEMATIWFNPGDRNPDYEERAAEIREKWVENEKGRRF